MLLFRHLRVNYRNADRDSPCFLTNPKKCSKIIPFSVIIGSTNDYWYALTNNLGPVLLQVYLHRLNGNANAVNIKAASKYYIQKFGCIQSIQCHETENKEGDNNSCLVYVEQFSGNNGFRLVEVWPKTGRFCANRNLLVKLLWKCLRTYKNPSFRSVV
ncbi:hypothetical protein EGR_04802 [Echinococcus granulosus]|uniref:Uncharacterized protein n=1 Tax=Echinococcus granulosus TaxID=6210 RepID=W6UG09_ECHGR|nr:hypothetical protein EGR_04802 [Echinococcus granulosus]EUB60420.1 hypothetical protein EGR_04802 [Echinococcus granulosus]